MKVLVVLAVFSLAALSVAQKPYSANQAIDDLLQRIHNHKKEIDPYNLRHSFYGTFHPDGRRGRGSFKLTNCSFHGASGIYRQGNFSYFEIFSHKAMRGRLAFKHINGTCQLTSLYPKVKESVTANFNASNLSFYTLFSASDPKKPKHVTSFYSIRFSVTGSKRGVFGKFEKYLYAALGDYLGYPFFQVYSRILQAY